MEDFEVKEGDETSECRFYSLLSTVSLLVIVYPASYASSVSIGYSLTSYTSSVTFGYSLSSLIRIKRLLWI